MNNKVKFAFAMGTFIILVIIGYFLMHKNDDVVFHAGDETIEIPKICIYVVGEVKSPRNF